MNPKLLEAMKVAGPIEWTEGLVTSRLTYYDDTWGFRERRADDYRPRFRATSEKIALALIEKHLREKLEARGIWIWRLLPQHGEGYAAYNPAERRLLDADGNWTGGPGATHAFPTYLDALIAATLAAGKDKP